MNIQAGLFKVLNVVKAKSGEFDKRLEEGDKDMMDYYYAAYYGGAYTLAKILINVYNGDMEESELEYLIKKLDSPENERKAS